MDNPGKEVLDAVALQDESASAELIRRVEPFVRAALGGWRFDSNDEREDVLQKIRCEILGSIRGYDPAKGGFSSWVYGIVRNVSNSWVREMDRRQETPFSQLPDTFEPAGKADEDVEEKEPSVLVSAFKGVYDELTPDERVVVDHMVAHAGGVGTHDDIARAQGISTAAAKQKVYRMKGRLKRAIQERLSLGRYPATKKGGSS